MDCRLALELLPDSFANAKEYSCFIFILQEVNLYDREFKRKVALITGAARHRGIGRENIYPDEVERVLLLHDAIADVAVIGVPDKNYEESVLACGVMASGQVLDKLPEILQGKC